MSSKKACRSDSKDDCEYFCRYSSSVMMMTDNAAKASEVDMSVHQ